MAIHTILQQIISAKESGKKLFAQLIDPDKIEGYDHLYEVARNAVDAKVDFFFFGGSLVWKPEPFDMVSTLRNMCNIPVVLFPSSPMQLRKGADAILFISLISGRNAEYLIGHHITAAPYLKNSGMEILPTGYILVHTGQTTTAQYISNTSPIPANKPEIAAATALAGEMLGMKLMYLDAGSGAVDTVSPRMVKAVHDMTSVPIIVGGGVRTPLQVRALHDAGADVVVIGTVAEENPHILSALCTHKVN